MDTCALFGGCTLSCALYQSPTELLMLYRIYFEILHSEFQQVFAFSFPKECCTVQVLPHPQCWGCSPLPAVVLFSEFTSDVLVRRVSKGVSRKVLI